MSLTEQHIILNTFIHLVTEGFQELLAYKSVEVVLALPESIISEDDFITE